MDFKAKECYMWLKKEMLPELNPQTSNLTERRFEYQSVKHIPVCAMEMGQASKGGSQVGQRSASLKVLPRKKSIRNIRESEPMQTKKISKNLKLTSLPKNLPLIGSLYFNN